MTAFVAFLIFSIAIYLPMRLAFGDASWLEPGGYPLPIQTSRILLYAGYFFAGVGVGAVDLRAGLLAENGEVAKRWPVWLAFALVFYGAILAAGLCPPQLGGGFQFAAAGLASRLWPCLCAVQRRDDVHGAVDSSCALRMPLAPAWMRCGRRPTAFS